MSNIKICVFLQQQHTTEITYIDGCVYARKKEKNGVPLTLSYQAKTSHLNQYLKVWDPLSSLAKFLIRNKH